MHNRKTIFKVHISPEPAGSDELVQCSLVLLVSYWSPLVEDFITDPRWCLTVTEDAEQSLWSDAFWLFAGCSSESCMLRTVTTVTTVTWSDMRYKLV